MGRYERENLFWWFFTGQSWATRQRVVGAAGWQRRPSA